MPTGTFQKIIDTLTDGNIRYAEGQYQGPDTSVQHRDALLVGQQPIAVVVACSDSRVSPEIIFDLGLGDLFVVRTAGNLVDDLELESIDFAIRHLQVPLVLVLGHTRCGAITAAANWGKDEEVDGKIAHFLKPAIEHAHLFSQDLIKGATLANVTEIVSRLNSTKRFATLIDRQALRICGGVYHMEDGKVRFL
jgi:carbonic anhydrase